MSDESRKNRSLGRRGTRSLPEAEADRQRARRTPRAPKPDSLRFHFGAWIQARRLEMAAIIIALIISQFFVLQAQHFEGRYARAREAEWWLPFWQNLESLELRLYDSRFTNRGPRVPACYDKIAIVGVDQKSLNSYETWPWPREWHARLVSRLKKAGAKVIVLDFDFNDKRDIIADATLAQAMADAGNVILPSFDTMEESRAGAAATAMMISLNSPLAQSDYDQWAAIHRKELQSDPKLKRAYETFSGLGLDEQTPDLGINYLPYDLDDSARRYPFRGEFNDRSVNIGGVGILAAATYQKMVDARPDGRYETALKKGVWPTLNGAARPVPLTLNLPSLPTSPVYFTTPIHWWGPPGTFNTYSYSAVLGVEEVDENNRVRTSGYSDADLKKHFQDRIVFVGATAHILKDNFSMPLFLEQGARKSGFGRAEAKISGVELHATVAAMFLDGAFIRTIAPHWTIASIYGLSLIACLWTVILRGWVNNLARTMQKKASKVGLGWWLHSWLWFSVYALLVSLPLILFWQAGKMLFLVKNLWVITVYPGVSAALTSATVLMLLFAAETIERRKTIAQLGSFMSPEVRDEILAQPENQYVRPRRLTATMLFTDLEGFTSYSEEHEPEEVVEALNDYFDRMVTIVNAHGGNVDKYIGDSVMAFFGFPLPRYDHAAQALLCAIAMQEECARFREETGVEFYMRVGVHTGEMIAGAIGAEKANHFNYTALGDTVNLASRLEGKNKEFGSWIMCSAATYEAAGGIVEAEPKGASIKGKSQDVEVFIVHGLKGAPEQDKHWGRQLPSPITPSAGELTTGAQALAEDGAEDMLALPAGTREPGDAKS